MRGFRKQAGERISPQGLDIGALARVFEIADLDLASQTKILHAIEEGIIQPLGNPSGVRVDVRIIACSNRDLEELVRQGKFREDLYYRLNVFPIRLLPLRERREDIPELVDALLRTFSAVYRKNFSVTPRCLSALMQYDWPGNVRELQNVLERACILADDGVIDLGTMPPQIRSGETPENVVPASETWLPLTLEEARKEAERQAIVRAIQISRGNSSEAARILGISRTTFYQKLKELGIASEVPFTVSS